MKIIGYTLKDNTSPFLDGVVKFGTEEFKSALLDCDYAIDITSGQLVQDPRPFLDGGPAYYGDYYDQHGNYSLHSLFPSARTVYPGIIYKASLLLECSTKNPLEEIARANIISYVPQPLFKILA